LPLINPIQSNPIQSNPIETAPLTKTNKKATRDHKAQLIQTVRTALDECTSVYVLAFPNLRSSGFQQIRSDLCHSTSSSTTTTTAMNGDDSDTTTTNSTATTRIFLGKLSLLQLALGRTTEDEYVDNVHRISKLLKGEVGLLLTNLPHARITQYFDDFCKVDYARAGTKAGRDVVVTNADLSAFPSSMLEPLRKLGAPVDLSVGTLVLQPSHAKEGWTLCRANQTLSPEQCKMLQQLNLKLSEFRVSIEAWWKDGEYFPHP
jgi:mRNA turnover protein 4